MTARCALLVLWLVPACGGQAVTPIPSDAAEDAAPDAAVEVAQEAILGASVEVPAGAWSGPPLTVQPGAAIADSVASELVVIAVGPPMHFGPGGAKFEAPVTVRLPFSTLQYDDAALDGKSFAIVGLEDGATVAGFDVGPVGLVGFDVGPVGFVPNGAGGDNDALAVFEVAHFTTYQAVVVGSLACDACDATPCTGAECLDGACVRTPKPDGEACAGPKGGPGACKAGECQAVAAGCDALKSCDDGDLCTTGDACSDGACSGTPVVCTDDGNPCTADACDPTTGACHPPLLGECSDGDACTVGDGCIAGVCTPGPPAPACTDDGNPCTTDKCNPATGVCHDPLTGTPCSDGDACTTSDECAAGACAAGPAVVCYDDNDPCTTDACDPGTGLCHLPMVASCDDGNACTTGDGCLGGFCVGGAFTQCASDGNPCTTDGCNPLTGACHEPKDGPCDDGSLCTSFDACLAGVCVGGPTACIDDANPCTLPGCDPKTGACGTPMPDGAPCDDGALCASTGTCQGGTCLFTTAGCPDDGSPCTLEMCTPAGCKTQSFDGSPCEDGNLCTTGDVCGKGICQPGAPTLCNDGNPCTLDGCSPGFGCMSGPAPDGTPCGAGQTCFGGFCGPVVPVTCVVGKTAGCGVLASDVSQWQTVLIEGLEPSRFVTVGFMATQVKPVAATLTLHVEAPVTPNPIMAAEVRAGADCSMLVPSSVSATAGSTTVSFQATPTLTHAIKLFLGPGMLPGATQVTVSLGTTCTAVTPQ